MASRSSRARLRLALVVSVAAALAALAPSAFASSPVVPIHLEKTCGGPLNSDDTSRCTITDSDSSLVPDGSTLRYDGVPLDGSGWELNSGVVLTTYDGSWNVIGTAPGHCTFSWNKLIGACTFGPGTGTLATLRATFHDVLTDFVPEPLTVTFALDGTYRT